MDMYRFAFKRMWGVFVACGIALAIALVIDHVL